MFRLVFIKLRNVYNKISKHYVSLLAQYPLAIIVSYLLLLISCSFGLFQIDFIRDNESLTNIKNSKVQSDIKIIDQHFKEDPYKLYLQHHLLDIGYYAEIIIKLKCINQVKNIEYVTSECSFLNQTILNDYNRVFDSIMSIYLNDTDEDTLSNTSTTITYNDLCPRRVNKCAIEGGILRSKIFQEKLLADKIYFSKNDAKHIFIDPDIVDGTSLDFLFGDYRMLNCDQKNCYINGSLVVRNRFDLLSNTPREKRLSIKYMHKFVEHMSNLEKSNEFKYFDFSYHTSHTVAHEIENYSKLDLRYVVLSLLIFLLIYYILLSFNIKDTKQNIFSYSIKQQHEQHTTTQASLRQKLFNLFKAANSFWIKSPVFLVFITVVQFIFTIFYTLGLLSLFGIPVNSLLYTILFVLLITSCHQTLLIYKNVTHALNKFNSLKSKTYNSKNFIQNDYAENSNSKIQESLIKAVRLIIVPSFFSLNASILTYFIIGLTSRKSPSESPNDDRKMAKVNQEEEEDDDEIAYEEKEQNGKMLNLNNQPSISSSSTSSASSASTTNPAEKDNFIRINQTQTTKDTNVLNSSQNLTKFNKTNKKSQRKNSYTKIFYNIFLLKPSFLYQTKFKYVLLIIFLAYMLFNIIICSVYSIVDLPLDKLIPKESYLARHMENHVKYFKIGPVVMVNFIEPLNYTNRDTVHKIRSLLNDMKNLKGMTQFEINWLDETIEKAKINAEYYESCRQDIFSFKCFHQSMKEVLSDPQNGNDVFYEVVKTANQSDQLLIKSSRMYLQLENFTGSMKDLNLMNSLKDLAREKHNFTTDSLIIFSIVFKYLEEMSEIYTAFISMCILTFECLFFGGLFLIFDLRSIFILMIICGSTIISIFSNVFLFNITLNIVTLFQFIMIPSIIFEFFFHTPYLFLYKSTEKNQYVNIKKIKSESSLASSSMYSSMTVSSSLKSFKTRSPIQFHRVQYLNFVFDKFSKTSCSFLFYNVFFGFIFMFFCSTYNFHTLFIILISTCFNLLIHISVFYPVLLVFFGTYWPNNVDAIKMKNFQNNNEILN